MKLPRRQSIVFGFIKAFETTNGRRPSVVEISKGLDMPHGWTWKVVVALERKGLASRVQNHPRVTKGDVFKLHEQHPDPPRTQQDQDRCQTQRVVSRP